MTTDSDFIKPYTYIFLTLLFLNLPGCTDQPENVAKTVSDSSQLTNAETTGVKQPSANKGTVKSFLNSGGYSYIEVDINGELFWLATSISYIRPGESIVWNDYAIMSNFNSKSLNRVFDKLLFVDRILPESDLSSNQHQGTVIEAVDSAGYSYIHVEENGKKIWLAAPTTKLEPGQTIRWNSGAPMRNFSSTSLHRSFDEIFFVSGVQI